MPKEPRTGRGMEAFFTTKAQKPKPRAAPEQEPAPPTVRTTLTLSQLDADRLELIRLHLRRRQGRGLTYCDVVAQALESLAEKESIPMALSPPEG
jgi:hypothetical protein